MCLTNNIDGWRYKCPFCNSRSLKHVNAKMKNNNQITDAWRTRPHYKCTNRHRFLVPIDMATDDFKGDVMI